MSFRPTRIEKSHHEHFTRTVDDEFAKFELKERAFRQADREERAAKLGLPISLAADDPLEVPRKRRSA
jgi:hypothetical protein